MKLGRNERVYRVSVTEEREHLVFVAARSEQGASEVAVELVGDDTLLDDASFWTFERAAKKSDLAGGVQVWVGGEDGKYVASKELEPET